MPLPTTTSRFMRASSCRFVSGRGGQFNPGPGTWTVKNHADDQPHGFATLKGYDVNSYDRQMYRLRHSQRKQRNCSSLDDDDDDTDGTHAAPALGIGGRGFL